MVNDLFLHEYLGRPENRVNVALFSMLQQSWFREWFLQSLGLPLDSIAYPPSNRNDCRPDLKVVDPARLNGAAVAWIEVELSKNTGQIKDYGEKLHPDPIRRLWGKRSHGGDLSLEEVAEFLNEQTGLDPQTAVNVQQLVELIREGLEGHSSSPGRSALTEEMRSHPVTTRASYRRRVRRERFEWPPEDCIPGSPWTGGSLRFGNRLRRTFGCGSTRRLSA